MLRVEGELVSCQRIMYLMNCFPPSFSNMMCAVVWHCVPAAVVHGLWCRHCDQGVETLVKLRSHPHVDHVVPLIQMMHAVSSAYQI